MAFIFPTSEVTGFIGLCRLTLVSFSLFCKHYIRKPQVWELSRLCPETSTILYVHEFGFSAYSGHALRPNSRTQLGQNS